MDSKVICFVSIPKNASQTLYKFLNVKRDDPYHKLTPILSYNHEPLSSMISVYEERTKMDFRENLFIFCFSRNPYDRAVSWFHYHRMAYQQYHTVKPNIEKDLHIYDTTFEDWVMKGCPHHFKESISQLHFIRKHKDCIDFIGRVETLQNKENSDLLKLEPKLREILKTSKYPNWKFRTYNISKKTNVSSHKSYETYYTPELKQKVYDVFKEDFEYFGYDK
jgi:hypothetical protein